MESKKDEKLTNQTLASDFINFKSKDSDFEWLIGLALVAGLFGDWGKDRKYDELDKRISKLETKTEMFEKIILK